MNNGGYLSSHEAAILSCLLLGGELYLLFTSEQTSHWAWKALFTCVVYTNFWYKYSGLIFPYTGKIFYICDPAVSVVFSCSDPPLVMTYDFVIGLHSVWHVTKATAQVRLHFITNSSICFTKVWNFSVWFWTIPLASETHLLCPDFHLYHCSFKPVISVLIMTTGEEKSSNESDLHSQINNVIKGGGGKFLKKLWCCISRGV